MCVGKTVAEIYHCMRIVWDEKNTSKDWNKGLIVPVFKLEDRKDCKNYRKSRSCTNMEIYETILESRIKNVVNRFETTVRFYTGGGGSITISGQQFKERYNEYG